MLRMRVFIFARARWQWNYFKWNWKLSQQSFCWGQRYHHDRGSYKNFYLTIQNSPYFIQLILRLVKMTYVSLKSEKSWLMELTWSLLRAEFIEISMLQQQAILSIQIRLMKVSHVQPIFATTTPRHSEIEMPTAKLVQVILKHSMSSSPVNVIYAQIHQQVQMKLAEIQHRNSLHLERFKNLWIPTTIIYRDNLSYLGLLLFFTIT